MKNFNLENIGIFKNLSNKHFTNKDLNLTGMEVSINHLQAGESVPFVHIHKKNEELYIITSGSGSFFIDGEEFDIKEGSLIRVSPKSERALTAGKNEDMCFICIQAETNSLHQYTKADAFISKTKASWMK